MEKKAADTKIRNYDTKIQTLRSDIEKTLDNVNAIKEHKKFLFKIKNRYDNYQSRKREVSD